MKIDPKSTKFEFRTKLFGRQLPKVKAGGCTGEAALDPEHLNKSFLKLRIDMQHLQAGSEDDTRTLKRQSFFNTDKYPFLTINSEKISQSTPGSTVYLADAMLTLKGIMHPVKIQFTANPLADGYRLIGTLTLKTSEWYIGGKGDLDDPLICFWELKLLKH